MNAPDDIDYQVVSADYSRDVKAAAWDIATGLQKIDGLSPSTYAQEIAIEYIAGQTSYDEFEDALQQHYSTLSHAENRSAEFEADITSLRIAEIIAEPTFTLSPASLRAIHGRIFKGVFEDSRWAGQWRTKNLSKNEPVIANRSINYTDFREIRDVLGYDFTQEKQKVYLEFSNEETVTQVMAFWSAIWQAHPFREGNTRATATYIIKYLRYLGIDVSNEPFAENAQFLRDALVLDNAPARLRNPEPLKLFGASLLDPRIELRNLRN